MGDVFEVNNFTDSLLHRVVTVYVKDPVTHLPEDFIPVQAWGSRILITNDIWSSTLSFSTWTWVMQKPEATDWSVLMSVLPHLRAPRLLVVDPAVLIPPRFLPTLVGRSLDSLDCTVLLYRSLMSTETPICPHVCYFPPVADATSQQRVMAIAQNFWAHVDARAQRSAATTRPEPLAHGHTQTAQTPGHPHQSTNQHVESHSLLAQTYTNLISQGMWMVLQLTPPGGAVPAFSDLFRRSATGPTLHWHRPLNVLESEEDFSTRYRAISRTLMGLFATMSSAGPR